MSEANKPTILVVEDDTRILKAMERSFGTTVEMLRARTLSEARTIYAERKDTIRLIALDGSLDVKDDNRGEWSEDVEPFLKEIRPAYDGMIVAISGNDTVRTAMHELGGCDCMVEKRLLPKFVLKYLGLG